MKRRPICVALLFFFACALAIPAQQGSVKVRIRIVLVDKELNQTPVPFVVVAVKGVNKTADVKTGLDGCAEALLPRGKYAVTTPKAVEVGGKRYSWNVQVAVSGSEQNVDLTNDNAKTEEISVSVPPASNPAGNGDLTSGATASRLRSVSLLSEPTFVAG